MEVFLGERLYAMTLNQISMYMTKKIQTHSHMKSAYMKIITLLKLTAGGPPRNFLEFIIEKDVYYGLLPRLYSIFLLFPYSRQQTPSRHFLEFIISKIDA